MMTVTIFRSVIVNGLYFVNESDLHSNEHYLSSSEKKA